MWPLPWDRRAAFLSSLRPSHSHTHPTTDTTKEDVHLIHNTLNCWQRIIECVFCDFSQAAGLKKTKQKKQDKNKTPCFCSSVTFLPYPNITSSESMNTTYAPYSHTVSENYNWVQRFGWNQTDGSNTAQADGLSEPSLCPPLLLPHRQQTHNKRRRTRRFSARQSHCLNHEYSRHKHAHLPSSFSLSYIYTLSLCIDFNIEL